MRQIRRKTKTIIAMLLLLCNPLEVFADVTYITVSKCSTINNNSTMTYRNSKSELDTIYDSLKTTSAINIREYGSQYQNIKGYEKTMGWLLENNIISRDNSIDCNGNEIKLADKQNPLLLKDSNSKVKKSDFVMALSKASYGVERSRPIIVKRPFREDEKIYKSNVTYGSDGEANGIFYDYSDGVYNVYTSSNVYELYFRKLLDKGLLKIKSFKDIDFIRDYNSYGGAKNIFPAWSNENGPLMTNRDGFQNGLGKTLPITSNLFKVNISYKEANYFMDETISTLDALKLIEKIMKMTEKDMTETESEIVSYKYGADYLLKMDEDSRKTVMYLIAKGVLNFENPKEFTNIFQPLTLSNFYTIMYRFANKSARVDFSNIQLTDSENYWLKKGMYKKTLELYSGLDVSTDTSVEEVDTIARNERDDSDSLFKNRKITIQANSSNKKTFQVTRLFYGDVDYMYKGKSIKDLKGMEGSSGFTDVKSVEKVSKGDNGAQEDGYSVVFEISATTSSAAVALIDNNVSITGSTDCLISKVDTVANVSSNGKTVATYLPKSALDSFGVTRQDKTIVAIADKYLVNTKTGTKAVLLDDNKRALVGNEIIDTDDNIVYGINGEVYYNLKIIVRLMQNSYIDKMWDNRIYTYSRGTNDALAKYQGIVDIVNYEDPNKYQGANTSPSVIDKALHADFSNVRIDRHSKPGTGATTSKKFISLLHSTKAMSVMYKDISSLLKLNDPVFMLVQWKYVLPTRNSQGINLLSSNSIDTINNYYNNIRNPSVSQMCNFINERPTDEELGNWWDSNIGLSDAVCNFLYNTNNIKYFTSGYLTPSITLLSNKNLSKNEQEEILEKLDLVGDYKDKFLKDGKIIDSLFGKGKDTDFYNQMQESRKFDFVQGAKLGSKGEIEYGDYVLDRTGVLYESYGDTNNNGLLTDPVDGIEKDMLCKSATQKDGTQKYYIQMNPRDKSSTKDQISVNSTYTINGEEYKCLDTIADDNTNLGTKVYYMLEHKDPVIGSMRSGSLSASVSSGSKVKNTFYIGSTTLQEYIANLTGGDKSTDYFYNPTSDLYTVARPLDLNSPKISSIPKNYLVYDPKGGINKVVTYKNPTNVFSQTEVPLGGTGVINNVESFPVLLLDKFNWSVKKNPNGTEELVKDKGTPFVCRENLIKVGITSAVIDSIVAKNYKYVSQSQLPDNAKVVIGDLTFYSSFGRLYSVPNHDHYAVSHLANDATNDEKVRSIVGGIFDGVNINIIKDGSVIKGSSITNYITADQSGKASITLSKSPIQVSSNDKTLIKDGGSLQIKTMKNLVGYQNGDYFNSFCFSLSFNNQIKFRPLDGESNSFTLVYSTDSGSNGYLDTVPFFTGTLNYTWDDQIFNRMSSNKYKPATNAFGLMDKIRELFDADNQEEWYSVIKLAMVMFLSYLIVMNFVGFILLRVPIIKTFLYEIKFPSGRDSKGWDLLKIVTCRFVTVEQEPKLTKTVAVITFLCIILAIILRL